MGDATGKIAPTKRKVGRPPEPLLDPELVAAALTELSGNVAATAKRFAVSRTAVQNMIRKRPALRQVVGDAREGMKDHAESALYRAVLAGEAWAVCFFLKTQAKDRGYVEKQQLEHSGEATLHITRVVVDCADQDQPNGQAAS